MKYLSYRFISLYAFLLAVGLLGFAGFMQLSMAMQPCPLCIMQRLIVAAIGLLFIAGIFHVPLSRNRKIYNGVILLFSILGILVSSRHIYLQHLPTGKAPTCGPGFNFLFQNLPTTDAIKMMFMGSGECSEVHWHFLGLTIPEWTFIFFIIFAGLAIYQMIRQKV